MKNILCISTGGTFNKIYNPLNGTLEIDKRSNAVREIGTRWLYEFELLSIIGKDSLEMTDSDRALLLATIDHSTQRDILVVHGTDTMELTAAFLADSKPEKRIVLTGAMVPFSIDPIEASCNFASAFGYLQRGCEHGVHIAMNGLVLPYGEITKERTLGRFIDVAKAGLP